jgi:hypothetical protein
MTITGPADFTPSFKKQTLSTNYLDFASAGSESNDFAQQYLPEVYEQEIESYGNRTVAGFLSMVGAEIPMTSDQVVWSEQNRLHIHYTGVTLSSAGAVSGITDHALRVGNTVLASNGDGEIKAVVTAVDSSAGTATIKAYTAANFNAISNPSTPATDVNIFVYGSEFVKGVNGMVGAINPQFKTFKNSPIIIKDKFEISGSDAAQIGWVEVAVEDGTSGYLWYLKAEGETRTRFGDYLEMSMIEGELATSTSMAATHSVANEAAYKGTEGLFAAILKRGNVTAAFAGSAASTLSDFDSILAELDKQGAIEENMLFLDRSTNLSIDDMLAAQNSYGSGGTSYGVFDNKEDMALNLGFSGFRRGSYDFYKTDWKYLNDEATRGATSDIKGVLVPAGTSTVYDQALGSNIRRPFLHVRYRSSETDDRKLKSWITGSVGGASTSDLDAMEVHYLSERCLCTQGANNFVLIK